MKFKIRRGAKGNGQGVKIKGGAKCKVGGQKEGIMSVIKSKK